MGGYQEQLALWDPLIVLRSGAWVGSGLGMMIVEYLHYYTPLHKLSELIVDLN